MVVVSETSVALWANVEGDLMEKFLRKDELIISSITYSGQGVTRYDWSSTTEYVYQGHHLGGNRVSLDDVTF